MKEKELVRELIAQGLMEGFQEGLEKREELGLKYSNWCSEIDHLKECMSLDPEEVAQEMKDLLPDEIWSRNVLKYSENEEEIEAMKKIDKFSVPKVEEMGVLTDKNLQEEDVWRLRDLKTVNIEDEIKYRCHTKCRIGVDDFDSYDFLKAFTEEVSQTGTQQLIVHARKAFLKGLNPAQNRSVPPLQYPLVVKLA